MSKHEFWQIAYRKRENGNTILNNQLSPFYLVKNTLRYWYADPHLTDVDNRTFLFAEAFDRIKRHGVIAYCELTEKGSTPWKVILDTGSHLSYPHLFKEDDQIYMIPESYVAEEIALYRAIEFPEKWEKECTLLKCVAVDSTIFEDKGIKWCFNQQNKKLMLYQLNEKKLSFISELKWNNPTNRPAGNLFYYNEKLIRPAQDCQKEYGSKLIFYHVKSLSNDNYYEEQVFTLSPDDIIINSDKKYSGIHTYNFSDKYEVIDLKSYEIDWLYYMTRPLWFVIRRIKRLFKH